MTYHRLTTLDFLRICDPSVAEFYRYWDSKRNGRKLPSRKDIWPEEIPHLLPGLVLVQVNPTPPRLVYRVVGTRDVEVRGYDPTGKTVEEFGFGPSLAQVLENYRLVIEEKSLVYDYEPSVSVAWELRESGTLLLPLSDDGETVNMVIAYTHFVRE